MMTYILADGIKEIDYLQRLKARQQDNDPQVLETVRHILKDIRLNGDQALLHYCKLYDSYDGPIGFIEKEEMKEALERIEPSLMSTLQQACDNIKAFHQKQLGEGFISYQADGSFLGQMIRPLERVGLYVPGGRAAYPSSVLMNAIPAKVAGVGELIIATPPNENGKVADVILACAALADVDRILLAGGAQACAALAYGTESVPQVDKLTGPGNVYVATAKQLLYGVCDIDMIAGPSEILVIADASANPKWIAADLLSQCEHDPLAAAILLTDSQQLADEVRIALDEQCHNAPREEIMRTSLREQSVIVVFKDLACCFEYANRLAPEHLEIVLEDALSHLAKVKHAGSVFLGKHTPEAVGDYFAGTNHVLPTSGTARFFSALGVDAFIRKMQYVSYSRDALLRDGKAIVQFAEEEGLYAHAASVKVRLIDEN